MCFSCIPIIILCLVIHQRKINSFEINCNFCSNHEANLFDSKENNSDRVDEQLVKVTLLREALHSVQSGAHNKAASP